jgi:hypothetical protein
MASEHDGSEYDAALSDDEQLPIVPGPPLLPLPAPAPVIVPLAVPNVPWVPSASGVAASSNDLIPAAPIPLPPPAPVPGPYWLSPESAANFWPVCSLCGHPMHLNAWYIVSSSWVHTPLSSWGFHSHELINSRFHRNPCFGYMRCMNMSRDGGT